MPIKTKYSCENVKLWHFGTKTRHFGKITAFTAFDENHGFRDFRVSVINLLSLITSSRTEPCAKPVIHDDR